MQPQPQAQLTIPSRTTLRRIDDSTKKLSLVAHATREDTETLLNLEKTRKLMQWVAPESIDQDENYESALNIRHSNTGKWFLESREFQEFLSSNGGLFWIYGKREQSAASFPNTD